MWTPTRVAIGSLLGGAVFLFAVGFIAFALNVTRLPDAGVRRADAIVVLTGGPTRIGEGARLLREGHGARLLISGVNTRTGRNSLRKLTGLDAETFSCCVDLGYAALDTAGNAEETSKWAAQHGYNRLLVVTSNFHMPRSLAELARAMPNVTLVAHPVMVKGTTQPGWWREPKIARAIAREYVKFIPAAARLLAARAFGSWGESSVAESPKSPPAKI